ncbi:MAG: hypothetical protein EOP52_05540 [Sphingobacteriales bacterium]|nr:MAG: hypothetical protein EOP52_05540 [Sphingobacteriales bacterium]
MIIVLYLGLLVLLLVTAFLGLRTSRDQRAFRTLSLPVLGITIVLLGCIALLAEIRLDSTPVGIPIRNTLKEPITFYFLTTHADSHPLVQERVLLQPGTATRRTIEFDGATALWTIGINASDRIVLFQSTSDPEVRMPSDINQSIQEDPSTLHQVQKSIGDYNRARLARNSLLTVDLLLMVLISLQTWVPKWTERMLRSERTTDSR